MSQLYGRAQPLGQPVIRTREPFFREPQPLELELELIEQPRQARSASVTASPQVGKAGQAIAQRRTVEIDSTVAMP